jgi:dTDP-4-dehydrorhamnose reductase
MPIHHQRDGIMSNYHIPCLGPELWGGLECTVNRVRDQYFSQMERNGHVARLQDIERFASLGIRAIRYPVLWENTAPDGLETADWSWPDERLPALRQLGVTPIVGLLHHGSGPRHTSLVDPAFPEQLAAYAAAVAARYPWVQHYTPVNEPLTTARFSGLYGVWYPHGEDDATFVRALVNQCRATVLAMRAIRAVNPGAQLVQTDDLSKTYGTAEMAELVAFSNERRWLSWDLLCGMVGPGHALWDYLLAHGAAQDDLLWLRDHPCPPDVVGVNYYATSERWLDHRARRYPAHYHKRFGDRIHADIETPRVLSTPTPGIGPLLQETWERYRLPVAVTEAHIDANREDQMRWLLEIWDAARQAREHGADVRAVTVWALLGSYDWNCLVTECKGYYEPGPFDVRGPQPRPTALADLMRRLASGRPVSHPVLRGAGWWRRPGRILDKAVQDAATAAVAPVPRRAQAPAQPILIVGAGTLGRAFESICRQRNLHCRLVGRSDMDIADPASVAAALAHHRPWAVVNASGIADPDAAERDAQRCFRSNTDGATVLAIACARHGLRLTTFSSADVFDGTATEPYVESSPVAPLNVVGHSKARAERRVLDAAPDTLLVRTGALFGPWNEGDTLTRALAALARGETVAAADDALLSPTYVPDLVHACLDLMIDGEAGIWHLANDLEAKAAPNWAGLVRRACAAAGIAAQNLRAVPGTALGRLAPRPRFGVLRSERAMLLPALDDALRRYARALASPARRERSGRGGCAWSMP